MGQLTIDQEYVARHPGSQELYRQAQSVLPSGVTHDSRNFRPFPIYVERAQGSHKWDVDGNEFIDYIGGHGALILGHCYPKVVQAIQEQAAKGTHFGACSELEITWAKLIQEMMPSAEMVRFVGTGTEAGLMAVRLARAFTGKNKLLFFQSHYHGWHDYGHKAYLPPFDVPSSVGIPPEVLSTVLVAPPNDLAAVRAILDSNSDVACIMVEPNGGTMGAVPTAVGFLEALREETRRRGILLVFDEVVTGFRMSPGGAQQFYGVIPDISTMAKIVAGGLAGGAIGARKDIMSLFEFRDDPQWNRFHRTTHYGTFNAAPVTAAAAIATLTELRDGRVHKQINQAAAGLQQELEGTMRANGVPGCVYGEASIMHLRVGKPCEYMDDCDRVHCRRPFTELLGAGTLGPKLSRAMRVHGLDMGGRAILNAAHTESDLAETVRAFDKSLKRLKEEGAL